MNAILIALQTFTFFALSQIYEEQRSHLDLILYSMASRSVRLLPRP